jgi:hypothetical protein
MRSFRSLETGLLEMLQKRLSEGGDALESEFAEAARALTRRLNHAARRLLSAESFSEWRSILLEAAAGFCGRAEILDAGDPEVAKAPAIATAIETTDTVIAIKSAGELSAKVFTMVADSGRDRCWLLPIEKGGRIAAVLYAEAGDGGNLDREALELLALAAGVSLPRLTSRPSTGLLQIESSEPEAQARGTRLGPKEQTAHLRAIRFALATVAEIRLFEPEAVRQGRQNGDLYLRLKSRIDRGRYEFDHRFLRIWPSMADYYHQEVIRTLANNDATAMGSEYPGAVR